jgi:hypothetical protein
MHNNIRAPMSVAGNLPPQFRNYRGASVETRIVVQLPAVESERATLLTIIMPHTYGYLRLCFALLRVSN